MVRWFQLALPAAAFSAAAFAQTSTPLDQNRVDRSLPSAVAPAAGSHPGLQGIVSVDEYSKSGAPIRNIEFEGAAVPRVVAKAAEAFIGKPATESTLRALAAAMSEAYSHSEVALFTIAIPQQDLRNGNVQVLVAEGHIEAVVLTGEVQGKKLRLVRQYADQLTRERPASRRTFERYLSLIQDIPGLRVSSQLQLGQTPGGVRLLLTLDYQRPTVTFGFDNRTTRLVRDGQFSGNARGYALFREGDETQLSAVASVNFKDQLYVGILHSTPIGAEGTRLSANLGLLRTRPPGSSASGEARTAGLTLNHPLIRSYRRNLTLTLALDGVNSKNAAFGSLIATERSRSLRAAAAFAQSGSRRAISVGAIVSKGLSILDAHVPPEIGTARFLKLNGRVSFDQTIGRRGVVRLRGSGQWTRDTLPAVERFSLGGPDFGRAYEVGLINADRGIAGLAEIAWRPIAKGKLANSELYGFADGSRSRLLERPGFPAQSFTLASAGGGARVALRDKAMIELELARVLHRPFPGYNADWRVSLSWKLSLHP